MTASLIHFPGAHVTHPPVSEPAFSPTQPAGSHFLVAGPVRSLRSKRGPVTNHCRAALILPLLVALLYAPLSAMLLLAGCPRWSAAIPLAFGAIVGRACT